MLGPARAAHAAGSLLSLLGLVLLLARSSHSADSECGVTAQSSHHEDGERVNPVDFPWAVAIYVKKGDSDTWEYLCLGTLISPTVVASAANCFWQMLTRNFYKERLYKVVAGKVFKGAKKADTEMVQWVNVSRIHVLSLYFGEYAVGNDRHMAVLELSRPLNQTPACVIKDAASLDEKQVGTAVRWPASTADPQEESDLTHDGDALEWSHLPYFKYKDCLTHMHPDPDTPAMVNFTVAGTTERLCSGAGDDNPWKGNSGAGFMVKSDGKWYLRGILMVSFYQHNVLGVVDYLPNVVDKTDRLESLTILPDILHTK